MYIARAAGAWAVSLALVAAGAARANVIYSVNVDTSAISGAAGYAIAFQLIDGSGGLSGDSNNTIKLTDFAFGSGSADGCPASCATTGGATGDATSSITLVDSDFFNSFAETFTPGNNLSFKVDLTTDVDAGGTPDAFAFSILVNGNSIVTENDPADTFLSIDIDSSSPTPAAFGTPAGSQPAIGAPTFALVPPGPGPLPEPGSLMLLIAGLAGLLGIGRRGLLQQ